LKRDQSSDEEEETPLDRKEKKELESVRESRLESENARLRRENEAMRRRLGMLYAVMKSGATFEAARQRLMMAAAR